MTWDYSGDWDDVGFAFSPDAGATFLSPVNPSDGPNQTNESSPTVTANADGKVFIAWSDNRNSIPSTNDDIYFAAGAMVAIAEPRTPGTKALDWSIGSNPTVGTLRIEYSISSPGRTRIAVYDLVGGVVATLRDGSDEAGRHLLTWRGSDRNGNAVSTGIYFVRAETPAGSFCRKVLFVSE